MAKTYRCDAPLFSPQTKKCTDISNRLEVLDFRKLVESILLTMSIISLGILFAKGLKKYLKTKPHPNHVMASKFLEENPVYPDDKENKFSIHCPLLNDTSNSPV